MSPNDFTEVKTRLADFEAHYNRAAKPFKWKFTINDLHDFLHRLDQHRTSINADPAQPRAA